MPMQIPGYFGGGWVGGVVVGLVWEPDSCPLICTDNPWRRLNNETEGTGYIFQKLSIQTTSEF